MAVGLGARAVSVATTLCAIAVSVGLTSGVATSTLTRMCAHPTSTAAPIKMRIRARANLSLLLLPSMISGLFSTCIYILSQNDYVYAYKCYESVTVLSPFLHIGPPLGDKVAQLRSGAR